MADDIRLVLSVDDRDLIRARKEQEKYQFRLAQIEKEYRKGNISAARYNRELSNQAKELAKLGGGYNKANSEVRKYAYSLRSVTDDQLNLAQAMAKSGKGMRRMEILAQQAGYQIGDFAVQVQGGTNAMVALGQQGSQLLGFFGPYGAIAGAALAIGTGIIAPFIKAKDTAKDLRDMVEELDKKLDDISSGGAGLEQALTKQLVDAQGELAKLTYAMSTEGAKLAEQYLSSMNKSFVIEDVISGKESAVSDATKKLVDAQIKVASLRVRQAFAADNDQVLEAANIAEAQRYFDRQDLQNQKDYEERLDRIRRIMGQINAERRQQTEAQNKINTKYEEQANKLEQNLNLLRLEQEFGKESLQYRGQESIYIEENIRAALEKEKVESSIVDRIVEATLQSRYLTQEFRDQLSTMRELKTAIEELPEYQQIRNAGAGYMARSEELALRSATGLGYVEDKPNKKKKTGAKPSTIEDTIKQLQRQADKEKQLVILAGQKRREEELFIDLKNANADADIKTSETRLRMIAQQIAEQEKLNDTIEKATEKQKEIADTIAGSMGDAFMSIVDGTKSVKDAFRDMARYIIKRLYEILVVEQMVQSIAGAIRGGASLFTGAPVGQISFSANGNAFRNGSIIPYANGGVVGGPTYFPMSGGKTGLMGEAGPEAIMPLKRGKDGKLGVAAEGGGGVTINQTFAFQANGDDSVKKIIAQAAPKIAAMTQQQIMDSRRRGGQMKQVFG